MNRYINLILNKCNYHLLSLKLDYSKYRGWTLKIHKEGSDRPIIFMNDYDEERVCYRAYYQLLKYLERLQEEA